MNELIGEPRPFFSAFSSIAKSGRVNSRSIMKNPQVFSDYEIIVVGISHMQFSHFPSVSFDSITFVKRMVDFVAVVESGSHTNKTFFLVFDIVGKFCIQGKRNL